MTNDSNSAVIRHNISLYPEQDIILVEFAGGRGLSLSAALRSIISEWAESKGISLVDPTPLRYGGSSIIS